jgi:hypothetical protein
MRRRIGRFSCAIAATGLLLSAAAVQLAAQSTVAAMPSVKSPGTAFMLSFAATAIPFAIAAKTGDGGASAGGLVLFSMIVGPSIGHFYAGQSGRAFAGIGVRVGILALTAGAAAQSGGCNGDFICIPPAVIIGGLAEGVAMIADIVTAPHSANLTNEKRVMAYLTPLPAGADGHGRLGIGMQLRLP